MSKKKAVTAVINTNSSILDSLVDSVYINPLTDFGFKRLFYNKELLMPFLNDVVGTDIIDIQYQPTEGLGWFSEERTAVFDLLCTSRDGEYFVVEMQFGQQTYFRERALFYGSQMIRKQAPRRKYWNFKLKTVYVVSVLNFNVFRDEASKDQVIERVYLYRESTGERFTDKLQMIFIQLPKFYKASTELQDNTDIWLFLLKNTFGLKSCPPEIKGEPFKLFLEIAQVKQLTPTEMNTYGVSLKRSLQMRDIANFARMDARMESSIAFALKLLKMNEPIDKIAYLTELTNEQIMELMSRQQKN
jgi:predicted transposase/invertase (TIGR01784 family)